MPTTVPGVLRFDLDSSLDTPSDGWTAELAGAAMAMDDVTVHTLPHGLLDALGNEVLAAHIGSGRVIERRVVGRADERRTFVRGVDALERTFRFQCATRYVPDPPTAPIDAAAEDGVTVKVGTWTAAAIAADLAADSGLTVFWGVRNYTFREPFDGIGTLYDLLRRLVEPWNLTPLGVDITALGTEIMIRQRLLAVPPDLTLTVAESRLVEIEVGPRRRWPYLGLVVLEGRPEEGYGFEHVPGEPPIPEASTVVVPYAIPVYDLGGNLISQVDGERTYRMPDNLLLRHVQREYQASTSGPLTQVKEEITDTTYEPSSYGPSGPLVQPLPLKALRTISTVIPIPASATGTIAALTLGETSREEVLWRYDARRFLAATTTRRFRRREVYTEGVPAPAISFPEVERIEETRTEKLPGWLEVATTRSTLDLDTGKVTSSVTLQAQEAAGLAPGGVRPPAGFSGSGGGGGMPPPGRVSERISDDPTAIPLQYANGNLTRADLTYIFEQCRVASGLVEYGLSARGPALIDVTKGSGLHLTDFVDADGTPILLDPAQVRRIAFTYVDASEYTCAIDAVFFRQD